MLDSLKLALPAALLALAYIGCTRVSWRTHPAFVTALLSEVFWQVAYIVGLHFSPWLVIPVQIIIRTIGLFEICAFNRVKIPNSAQLAVMVHGILAFFAAITPELTALQRLYLWRQNCYLAIFSGLAYLVVLRWRHPMLECRRHRIQRLGWASWTAVTVCSGVFVPGGFGWRLFPYSKSMYAALNVGTYVSLLVVVSVMAWALAASLPRKVPAKVNRAIGLRFTRRVVDIRRVAA